MSWTPFNNHPRCVIVFARQIWIRMHLYNFITSHERQPKKTGRS